MLMFTVDFFADTFVYNNVHNLNQSPNKTQESFLIPSVPKEIIVQA